MMKSTLAKMRLRRAACFVAALAACVVGASAEARATPLAEYRRNVRAASEALGKLASLCERLAEGEKDAARAQADVEAGLPLTLPAEQALALAEARRLVPPRERVEWGGAVTLADNVWLHAALQEYEQRSSRMLYSERAATVRGIAERLGALEARLTEAEGAAALRDKDAEKGRLATILRGPDFNQKPSEGGALQSLVGQFFDWLTRLFPRLRPLRPAPNAGLSLAAQVVIFALALGVVGFLVWKYWWRLRAGLGGGGSRERGARVVLGERIAADETSADLLAEAERLARAGDLRGAIRKAYVGLLCELGDRKVIGLAQHKTNRDYLRAVRAAAPRLHSAMLLLTDSFERHWYGLEAASELDWQDFRTRCRAVQSQKV